MFAIIVVYYGGFILCCCLVCCVFGVFGCVYNSLRLFLFVYLIWCWLCWFAGLCICWCWWCFVLILFADLLVFCVGFIVFTCCFRCVIVCR